MISVAFLSLLMTLELNILIHFVGMARATTKALMARESPQRLLLVETVVQHHAVLVADSGQAATSYRERKTFGKLHSNHQRIENWRRRGMSLTFAASSSTEPTREARNSCSTRMSCCGVSILVARVPFR